MAFAAPLIPLIPTILGAGSAIAEGVGSIQNGYYQAAVMKNNAAIAEYNAASTSEASQREAGRSDREYAAQLGSQLAAQGASGLDILGRTQVATRNVTRRVRSEAAGDIRMQGTNEARGMMQDAANFRGQGRQAKTQGLIGGIGSFVKAGALVSDRFGGTGSLATSRTRAGRRPRSGRPQWYGGG